MRWRLVVGTALLIFGVIGVVYAVIRPASLADKIIAGLVAVGFGAAGIGLRGRAYLHRK